MKAKIVMNCYECVALDIGVYIFLSFRPTHDEKRIKSQNLI